MFTIRQVITALSALVFLVAGSGCATLVNGTTQKLIVNSNPPGATFEVDGQSGVTPGTVEVSRREKTHTIHIHKPGYEPAEFRIQRKFGTPWLAGDAVGAMGLAAVSTATWPVAWVVFPASVAVDYGSGGAFYFPDDNINISLQRLRHEPTTEPVTPVPVELSDPIRPNET